MHAEQRERTQEHLKARGIERTLFANLASVKWLTGFFPPVQVGSSPFAGGPPLVWYEDGEFTLIVLDAQASDAEKSGCQVVSYLGYTVEQPIAGADHLANALREVLAGSGARAGRVGVEEQDLPVFLWRVLRSAFPDEVEVVSVDGWLEPLRAVKTDEELRKLRDNFALTDLGHATARAGVQAGRREIDVWTRIHSAIQEKAGRRVMLGNDCIVGYREFNVGGWPLDYEIRPGDSFIVDLSTQLHGYWSDSCGTYYAGEPSAEQKKMHRVVEDALEFAISLVRPGAVAREIDQQVRRFIADAGYPVYEHHTGHGVGVTGHEAPRIVPYNDEALQAGMVIMLEPGIYLPGETAVRLEDAVLVTSDGAEVLTHHDKRLP